MSGPAKADRDGDATAKGKGTDGGGLSNRRKAIVAVVALVAVAALWFLLPVRDWIDAFQGWIVELGALGVAVYVGLYTLMALVLGPAWALTVVAGLAYGWWGIPLALLTATFAASVAFLVARHLARDRVTKLAEGNEKLRALNRAVGKEGWKVVALTRLSPALPFGLQNYFFGVTDVGFAPYAAASFVAMAPGTALYAYIGTLGNAAGDGGGPLKYVLLGVGLVATVVVVWLVTKRAKAELAEMDLE